MLCLSLPPQIPEEAIQSAIAILKTGNLFRYGEESGESSHTSILEEEFAKYIGSKFCIGVHSGGGAIFLALKSLGVQHNDHVLFNAFTLAPVPGAIDHAGAIPVPVDTTSSLTIDLYDLEEKIQKNSAKFLLLSYMRGHIPNLEKVLDICQKNNIKIIEDCAHTLGAKWKDKHTGSYGDFGCFSAQSFKHINSGEGGLLTCSDDNLAAKAILYSGSYALYQQHLSKPHQKFFDKHYGKIPNYSMRMSNLTAALLRPQLPQIKSRVLEWNSYYEKIEKNLSLITCVETIQRPSEEKFVGSSFQFFLHLPEESITNIIGNLRQKKIHLKWFGLKKPEGFTESYHSWTYMPHSSLKKTDKHLSKLIDLRIPLSLGEESCEILIQNIKIEINKYL